MSSESNSIFRLIGLTSKYLDVFINEKMTENGIDLTKNQYVLLKVLLEKEGSTQNDLASQTERDKTSMTRLVNAMEAKGLIIKVIGKQDRRKRRIYLNKYGKEMLAKAIPCMQTLEEELIKSLNKVDVETTMNVLDSVQAKVLGDAHVLTLTNS